MCSKCLRTLQYTDRQRAFVIYGAIIYSKHRYENRDMTFAQTQISFMRSLSTTKIFFRPLSCIRTLDRNSTIYSIFGTTSRGPWGTQPVVVQNLVSHIILLTHLRPGLKHFSLFQHNLHSSTRLCTMARYKSIDWLTHWFAHPPCKFQRPSFGGCRDITGGVKIAQRVKNWVKKISHLQKSQDYFWPLLSSSSESSSQKGIQKLDLWPINVFRPIGHNANAKFKGVPNFLGDRYQKSVQGKILYSRPLQAGQVSRRYDKTV